MIPYVESVVNSQISFDEFLLMHMKKFIYEATYNPVVVHSFGLHNLDPNDPTYKSRNPEYIAQSDSFREKILDQY